jgi:phosphate transport system protein
MVTWVDHSSKTYEAQLRRLHERLLDMGSIVEEMLTQGELAFETRDATLAETIKRFERRVDKLECEIDELAMRLVALRQPVASDLRFIMAAFKLVGDIQRMGKSYANICDRLVELCAMPPLDLSRSVDALHRDVRDAVHDAISVLASRDADQANALLPRDDDIDEQYHHIFREAVALMASQPDAVYRATRIQMVAKNLERIADHAMNIAKSVVFIVTGTDIRHGDDSGSPVSG